jgi:hypothetical protein
MPLNEEGGLHYFQTLGSRPAIIEPITWLWLENAGLNSYSLIQTGFSTIVCLAVHCDLG